MQAGGQAGRPLRGWPCGCIRSGAGSEQVGCAEGGSAGRGAAGYQRPGSGGLYRGVATGWAAALGAAAASVASPPRCRSGRRRNRAAQRRLRLRQQRAHAALVHRIDVGALERPRR